jgi:hypothetical protein
MTRRAAPFRQVDVARALRAAKAAGLAVASVEIDGAGKIVLTFADGAARDPAAAAYDKWKERHARSA